MLAFLLIRIQAKDGNKLKVTDIMRFPWDYQEPKESAAEKKDKQLQLFASLRRQGMTLSPEMQEAEKKLLADADISGD